MSTEAQHTQRAETITVTDTDSVTTTAAETPTATPGLDWVGLSWYAMGAVYALIAGAVIALEPLANAVAVAGILLLLGVYSAAFGWYS